MIGSRTGKAHFFVVGQTDSASRPAGDECTREVLRVAEMLSTAAGQVACDGGMPLLVSRVLCEDAFVTQALENTGFRLMDTLVTFLRTDVNGENQWQQLVRNHVTGDEVVLVGIAEESFRDGHFYSDIGVSLESCRTVYSEWTRNSCRGRADAVLVVDSEDGPAGFITCLIDPELRSIGIRRGIIELVAVHPCRQHMGVGRRLVSGALQWFAASGVTEVEVGTQVSNVAAGSLYLNQGFRPACYRHTFHRWLD
jgi:ribosomal protein S18 acetylase RimI-like enzyme